MKKNYILLLFTLLVAFATNAQITLTHSTTEVITAPNTVACPTEPTNYLRVFDFANEFSLTNDFEITQVEFGVEISDTQPITLNLYTSDGLDPTTATLTNIYTSDVPVGVAEEGTVVSHTLSSPITLPSTTILVIEIAEASDGTVFRIGSNTDGQTAPSWLVSATCGAGTVAGFGFDNHYVMNVIGNTLSVEEFSAKNVSISPNPATDIINIEIPNSNTSFVSELYSITGQLVLKSDKAQLDVSRLNTGIYMLRVQTENGVVSRRIIKN